MAHPEINTEIDQYCIHFLSHPVQTDHVADIILIWKKRQVGYIEFLADGKPLSANFIDREGAVHIHYPISRFADVINILQTVKHPKMQLGVTDIGNLNTEWLPCGTPYV